jgi:hypothetical protein
MSILTVVIDPDGTQDLGLYVLVSAPTGIVYEIQCAGTRLEQRRQEGYLVPVGDARAAIPFRDFFARSFRGNPPPAAGSTWTRELLDELSTLVREVPFWVRSADGSDSKVGLELDRPSGIDAITEAWVPVMTPVGNGILLFKNSD